MTIKYWAALLLSASLFGSGFMFAHIAVDALPPVTVAAARAALALPIAWVFLRLIGDRLPMPGKAWGPLLVLGLLTAAIPYVAIAWGQVHIASGLAGILFGAIPVFTVLFAPILARDEHLTLGRLGGVAVGLAGVVLVLGPQALLGIGDQLWGTLITLLAALSYALGGIYARTRADLSPVVMTVGQLATASLMLVPLSLLVDTAWTFAPPIGALAAVMALAILSTAAPTLLLFWVIQGAGASSGSLVAFFIPVVAVALGAATLGEVLPWQAFAGLGLILIGAAVVGGRLRIPTKRNPAPAAAKTD